MAWHQHVNTSMIAMIEILREFLKQGSSIRFENIIWSRTCILFCFFFFLFAFGNSVWLTIFTFLFDGACCP